MTAPSLTPRKTPAPAPQTEAEWAERLRDPWWRITSGVLYKIMVKGDDQDEDETGELMPFLPNVNQLLFLSTLHHRNVVLKARQLGFTTLAAIMALDHALFVPNQRCGIIAHEMDVAEEILRDKVVLAYENLPEALRASMPVKKKTEKQIIFAHNNSSLRVATSMRGGTIHFLHISEMGKIAAKYPKKAVEIVTGSLPAVPKSSIATIESTAEGQDGEFFKIAKRAENIAMTNAPLMRKTFKFHFFPWFMEPGYEEDYRGVAISPTQHEYFDNLEEKVGVPISMRKRAWYVLFMENEFSGDQQKMYQEMPSTPEEAWSRSTEGTYLTPQLDAARKQGRICKVPHRAGLPVHTFWDIGGADGTGIWMGQQVGMSMHMLAYIEDWSKGYEDYIKAIEAKGWVLGDHYLPHDAAQERPGEKDMWSPMTLLTRLRPRWSWRLVPRIHDFQAGITTLRQRFPELWFDEEGCKEGLQHLSLYRKKFNTRLGTFVDEPEKHDGHSEAPDALRQWAQGFEPSHVVPGRQRRSRPRATGMTA